MTLASVLTAITKIIAVKQLFIVAAKIALESDFVDMQLTEK